MIGAVGVCVRREIERTGLSWQVPDRAGAIREWWPDADELRHEQRERLAKYNRWSKAARIGYNAGILSFLCAIAAALLRRGQ